MILEGSGSAVPPVPWDAGVLVVPASAPAEYLGGYLGPVSALVVGPRGCYYGYRPDYRAREPPQNLSELRPHLQRFLGDGGYVVTDFIPVPLADVRGKRAFFVTTAPTQAAANQVEHLRSAHGCTVVGWSAKLADRAGLAEDLDAAQAYDVLVTELKAAAVDIGVERAVERGAEVVFVDNRAVVVEGSTDLDTALGTVIGLAVARGTQRGT